MAERRGGAQLNPPARIGECYWHAGSLRHSSSQVNKEPQSSASNEGGVREDLAGRTGIGVAASEKQGEPDTALNQLSRI